MVFFFDPEKILRITMDLRALSDDEVRAALSERPTLVQEFVVGLQDADRVTLLWQAASLNRMEVLEAMMRIPECNVNFQRPSDGVSCLYVAAQNGHLDVCRALLRGGADVNIARNTGATPLFIATQQNNLDIVRLLLADGANVDAQNDQRCTPFVLACFLGFADAAQILLAAGADWCHSGTGSTGYEWAKKNNHPNTVAALRAVVEQQLISQGRIERLRRCFFAWAIGSETSRQERLKKLLLVQEQIQRQKERMEKALTGGPLPSEDILFGGVDQLWNLQTVSLTLATQLDVDLAATARRHGPPLNEVAHQESANFQRYNAGICETVREVLTQIAHSPQRNR